MYQPWPTQDALYPGKTFIVDDLLEVRRVLGCIQVGHSFVAENFVDVDPCPAPQLVFRVVSDNRQF